ncbi:hypothetical protein CDL15_Pgr010543 [Punica granatum]|uniref:Pentatricopeptide repeat-containing protein n=1 Tax=Punica granatum TaxID=22663 RepID=A0A218XX88_PUNGR|nr:hypothetical protein CDL15_Pgr010543 [Punica granatum]
MPRRPNGVKFVHVVVNTMMWHVAIGPYMKSAGFQPDSTQTGPVIPDLPIKSDYTSTCLSSSFSSSAAASPILFDLSVFFLFFFDFQNVLELFRDSGILLRKCRGFFSKIRFPEVAGYNNKPTRHIFSLRESDFSGVDEKGFINMKFISSLEAKASEPLSTGVNMGLLARNIKFPEIELKDSSQSLTYAANVFNSIKNPNLSAYNIMIRAFASKHGSEKDIFVNNNMISMYSSHGAFVDYARKVFDAMLEWDVVSWNSMIVGYRAGNI